MRRESDDDYDDQAKETELQADQLVHGPASTHFISFPLRLGWCGPATRTSANLQPCATPLFPRRTVTTRPDHAAMSKWSGMCPTCMIGMRRGSRGGAAVRRQAGELNGASRRTRCGGWCAALACTI